MQLFLPLLLFLVALSPPAICHYSSSTSSPSSSSVSSDASEWRPARATYYAATNPRDAVGGACGYGDLVKSGYGMATVGLSETLFDRGQICGACFELRCVDDLRWCIPGTSIIVTATNFCAPNYGFDPDGGGHCNPPNKHFVLPIEAFEKIAIWKAGNMPVQYRSTVCPKCLMDIEELADKLQIGPKFHVVGMSLGAYPVYGCLKYIPHRLCGASLVVPLINYWWRRMPQHLLNAAIKKLPFEFRLTLRVAHYCPWLLYWWMTQKWFPTSRDPKKTMTKRDLELAEIHTKQSYKESCLRQGEYVSTQRDIIAGYGNWEFDPTELNNPFSDSNKGSVHMWCALEDKQILRDVLLYICDKLPWIKLHEVPEAGHFMIHEKRHFEAIIKAACT